MGRGIEVTFAGHLLNDYVDITDVRRPIGNNIAINLETALSVGQNVQERKIEAKYIEVDFLVRGNDVETVKHQLANIFNTSQPARLTFEDEPDKYYLAMATSEVATSNVVKWFQRATVTFLIPDGVAHSSSYRRVEEQEDYVDKSVLTIRNNGSVDAYPIITIKHYEENGWLGLVNKQGALEIGDRTEADVATSKQSETQLHYREGELAELLNLGAKNVARLNDNSHSLTGKLVIREVWGRPHIALE